MKKRSLFALVVLVVALLLVACGGAGPGATLPDPGGGNGGGGNDGSGNGGSGNGGDNGGPVKGECTREEPCVIHTIEQLQAIGKPIGFPNLIEINEPLKGHYVLGDDIDASATKDWVLHGVKGFIPIGTRERAAFEGTLDGAGHTITGLYIEFSADDGSGLFGVTGDTAEIRNIHLADVNIETVLWNVPFGTLVGHNKGTIENVSVAGTADFALPSWSQTPNIYVGGLVGTNEGTIQSATTTMTVTSELYAGGLVGQNAAAGKIDDSRSTAKVFGIRKERESGGQPMGGLGPLGGLVAFNQGLIENSHTLLGAEVIAQAAKNGTGSEVGGLVGLNQGEIKSSTAAATVEGYQNVGGLVGRNRGVIEDSSSNAEVTGYDQALGGLVGENSEAGTVIARSYSGGSVFGKVSNIADRAGHPIVNMGGLVGWNFDGAEIVDSYSTASVGGNTSLDGVGGLVGSNALGAASQIGYIKTSYSTGAVPAGEGHANVGGFVGGALGDGGGDVVASFWDMGTSGTEANVPGAGLGRTTGQMNNPSTFRSARWDEAVWHLENDKYPTLRGTPAPDGL